MKSDKNNSDNLEILQLEDCFSGLSESVVRSVRFCITVGPGLIDKKIAWGFLLHAVHKTLSAYSLKRPPLF